MSCLNCLLIVLILLYDLFGCWFIGVFVLLVFVRLFDDLFCLRVYLRAACCLAFGWLVWYLLRILFGFL